MRTPASSDLPTLLASVLCAIPHLTAISPQEGWKPDTPKGEKMKRRAALRCTCASTSRKGWGLAWGCPAPKWPESLEWQTSTAVTPKAPGAPSGPSLPVQSELLSASSAFSWRKKGPNFPSSLAQSLLAPEQRAVNWETREEEHSSKPYGVCKHTLQPISFLKSLGTLPLTCSDLAAASPLYSSNTSVPVGLRAFAPAISSR